MKKILLFLTLMLATVGMTMAQDIWTVGYRTNSTTGKKVAVSYLNGNSGSFVSNENVDYEGVDVATKSNGTSYWAVKGTTSTTVYSYVYECGTTGAPILNVGNNAVIHDLAPYNNELYAVGYKLVDGHNVACFWNINSTDARILGTTSGYNSEAFCGLLKPAGQGVICVGYQYDSDGYRGKIWHYYGSTSVIHTFDVGTKIYGITFYNGYYYTVGTAVVDGQTKLRVWKTSETDGTTTLVYTILENNVSNPTKCNICIAGGDCYVNGQEGTIDKIWKNGQELYSTSDWFFNMTTNGDGLYYVGRTSGQGTVWKDGEVLYSISGADFLMGITVAAPECEDESVRTLPFFDGFESGETEWNCWTKIDVDNDNANLASYWDIGGKFSPISSFLPYTGDHYAKHQRNTGTAQEGWLVSPRLFLQPGRDATMLTYYSRNGGSYVGGYGSVWISTSTDPTNTSAFTQIYTEPNSKSEWAQRTVDLTAYQGQAVYIAFRYYAEPSGGSIPAYYIDDVSVTEFWDSCGTASVPYEMDFEGSPQEPGYCWYILDEDHTGGNRCWRFNESEQCAYHPWGQNNGVKQEGWLFSPSLDLTETGVNYTLTFNSKNNSSGSDMKNSVWISIDHAGEIPDPQDFAKIWEETNYTSTWAERTIDLTSYAGHVVNVAFKYEGTYAHDWYVDDISFTTEIPEYNINVEANNASWGTVSGGGTYTQGSSCTITATPTGSYVFLKWMRDGSQVSTNASYTFVVNESATYTAVFGEPAVTYYTITTDVTPAGAGTVTGGDTYASGATAVLTATPNQGWQFNKWNDNNTENPRSITVTGNANYTAIFVHTTHTLTVNASPAEGGTVTGGGTYEYGQTVTLNASPNEGYVFLNWSDGSTSASHPVMVTGDAEYTAYFAAEGVSTYTITVVPNDPSLGEVTGGGTYAEGTVITLTATPIGYATFVNWSDGSTKNPRNITVTENATYTANFEMAAFYTITVVSQNPEMGSVNGGGSFPMGAEVTIQANPFGGYYFDGWTDNNYDNPRTITVSGDATYTARFSAQQTQTYMLTVTCNPSQGAVIGTGTYSPGTVVNVEAIPYEGFAFDRWNDGVTDNPRSVTVDANITLVAFFKGTGVDENGETLLSVYPNPAKETIRIEGLEPNAEVSFYNVLGMLVKQVNANADQEINVSDLATGLYLVRCGRQTLRFVKE